MPEFSLSRVMGSMALLLILLSCQISVGQRSQASHRRLGDAIPMDELQSRLELLQKLQQLGGPQGKTAENIWRNLDPETRKSLENAVRNSFGMPPAQAQQTQQNSPGQTNPYDGRGGANDPSGKRTPPAPLPKPANLRDLLQKLAKQTGIPLDQLANQAAQQNQPGNSNAQNNSQQPIPPASAQQPNRRNSNGQQYSRNPQNSSRTPPLFPPGQTRPGQTNPRDRSQGKSTANKRPQDRELSKTIGDWLSKKLGSEQNQSANDQSRNNSATNSTNPRNSTGRSTANNSRNNRNSFNPPNLPRDSRQTGNSQSRTRPPRGLNRGTGISNDGKNRSPGNLTRNNRGNGFRLPDGTDPTRDLNLKETFKRLKKLAEERQKRTVDAARSRQAQGNDLASRDNGLNSGKSTPGNPASPSSTGARSISKDLSKSLSRVMEKTARHVIDHMKNSPPPPRAGSPARTSPSSRSKNSSKSLFNKVTKATRKTSDWLRKSSDWASSSTPPAAVTGGGGGGGASSLNADMPNAGVPRGLMTAIVVSAIAIFAIWYLREQARRRQSVDSGASLQISEQAFRSRQDLIRAFHALALRSHGVPGNWWTHRQAEPAMAKQFGEKMSPLADLYEYARYAPGPGLPEDKVARAENIIREADRR